MNSLDMANKSVHLGESFPIEIANEGTNFFMNNLHVTSEIGIMAIALGTPCLSLESREVMISLMYVKLCTRIELQIAFEAHKVDSQGFLV
jgi:hypothetical protein